MLSRACVLPLRLDQDRSGDRKAIGGAEHGVDFHDPVAGLRKLDSLDLPGSVGVQRGWARYRLVSRRRSGEGERDLLGCKRIKIVVEQAYPRARRADAARRDRDLGHPLRGMDVDESGAGGDGRTGGVVTSMDGGRHRSEKADDEYGGKAERSLG